MSEGTTKETIRLEAFSDAVFAIAITILALELRLPDGEADVRLRDELLELWPAYVAYLLSFSTILIMWLNHHALLLWVRRAEGKLLVANGVLLMLVAAVPFPTALVSHHLGDAGGRLALAAFCGLFAAITLAFAWVWATVVRHRREIAPALPDREVRATAWHLSISLAGYLAALALALVNALAGLGLALGMAAFWLWAAYRRHRAALET